MTTEYAFARPMTVGALIDHLTDFRRDLPVKVWLPGSRICIAASRPFAEADKGGKGEPTAVLVEGWVQEGSALA